MVNFISEIPLTYTNASIIYSLHLSLSFREVLLYIIFRVTTSIPVFSWECSLSSLALELSKGFV